MNLSPHTCGGFFMARNLVLLWRKLNFITMIKSVHSYWAYLVLLILIIAVVNAIVKTVGGKEYSANDFRISLFTLISAKNLLYLFTSLPLIKDLVNSIFKIYIRNV